MKLMTIISLYIAHKRSLGYRFRTEELLLKSFGKKIRLLLNILFVVIGILAILNGYLMGIILIAFAVYPLLKYFEVVDYSHNPKAENYINIILAVITILILLSVHWRPLGVEHQIVSMLSTEISGFTVVG